MTTSRAFVRRMQRSFITDTFIRNGSKLNNHEAAHSSRPNSCSLCTSDLSTFRGHQGVLNGNLSPPNGWFNSLTIHRAGLTSPLTSTLLHRLSKDCLLPIGMDPAAEDVAFRADQAASKSHSYNGITVITCTRCECVFPSSVRL
ncbi:unnamed protein product [Protopolystoma xenopodis]|uniref:Uncharacterized protein n=1 Tax=Protopolystoma xenopodis TaxID=117903 RepID=A0A3S5B3A4_9PLAT|nr:unnamed protein product [Protopolystoma xenopodis]